jgi:hypothetical protein
VGERPRLEGLRWAAHSAFNPPYRPA